MIDFTNYMWVVRSRDVFEDTGILHIIADYNEIPTESLCGNLQGRWLKDFYIIESLVLDDSMWNSGDIYNNFHKCKHCIDKLPNEIIALLL